MTTNMEPRIDADVKKDAQAPQTSQIEIATDDEVAVVSAHLMKRNRHVYEVLAK